MGGQVKCSVRSMFSCCFALAMVDVAAKSCSCHGMSTRAFVCDAPAMRVYPCYYVIGWRGARSKSVIVSQRG